MAHRNVRTRLAVLHHHGDDLVEMEETFRERDEVPLDETAIVIYLCPRCETIVTVGAITTEARRWTGPTRLMLSDQEPDPDIVE